MLMTAFMRALDPLTFPIIMELHPSKTFLERPLLYRIDFHYGMLYTPAVTEALKLVGSSLGDENHITCSDRAMYTFADVHIWDDVWAFEFKYTPYETRKSRINRICALAYLSAKEARENEAVEKGLPKEIADINGADYLMKLPADRDGCKTFRTPRHYVIACPMQVTLTGGDTCPAIELVLSRGVISNVARLAWELPNLWTVRPPCIDLELPYSQNIVATEIIDSEDVAVGGGQRRLEKHFYCTDTELGRFAKFTYFRAIFPDITELEFTPIERGDAQRRANNYCSQVWDYLNSDPLVRDIVLHGYQ